MPKSIINFSKCVIYKIVCNNLKIADVYVGSTTEFTKRKHSHKVHCKNESHKEYNFKVYQVIRENGGWENWEMVEIEKYPCLDRNEARARERYWYEMLSANLNMRAPEKVVEYKYNCKNNKNEIVKPKYQTIKYEHPAYYKSCKMKDTFESICKQNRIYMEKHLKDY